MGELGAAGTNLRWLMHGRYNFKGVPAPMLVHEVGEPGLSPLRAPASGTKAWRELPIWRRPPVVALEVLLVGALGLGLFWTAFRSPPAIAFAERDWVVVADLQNRTSEKLLDDSLDMALRIGMEQSAYVNVISDRSDQDRSNACSARAKALTAKPGPNWRCAKVPKHWCFQRLLKSAVSYASRPK